MVNSGVIEPHTRGLQLVSFITQTSYSSLPQPVLQAAKYALIDYLAVAIAAVNETSVRAVKATAYSWQAKGHAQVLLGRKTTPALAALINGTMAHAMDFDDTHPGGTGHPSAVCWSSALAIAEHYQLTEQAALVAFVIGFEVMAKLGGGAEPGVGRNLQRRGWHPTAIIGRAAAGAIAASLLKLNAQQTANALGAAATMMGGLRRSSGTHGKPFHAGKAAMDGILAAQLADNDFIAAHHFYELDGWLKVFIQDDQAVVPPLDFGQKWELLTNGFKLFASCRATHSIVENIQALLPQIAGRKLASIKAQVCPLALVNAGYQNPLTLLEAKFSTSFCIGLALNGYSLDHLDFSNTAMLHDPRVAQTLELLTLETVDDFNLATSALQLHFTDGSHLAGRITALKGNADNPLTEQERYNKFSRLTVPFLGVKKSQQLYEAASQFEHAGALATISRLVSKRN